MNKSTMKEKVSTILEIHTLVNILRADPLYATTAEVKPIAISGVTFTAKGESTIEVTEGPETLGYIKISHAWLKANVYRKDKEVKFMGFDNFKFLEIMEEFLPEFKEKVIIEPEAIPENVDLIAPETRVLFGWLNLHYSANSHGLLYETWLSEVAEFTKAMAEVIFHQRMFSIGYKEIERVGILFTGIERDGKQFIMEAANELVSVSDIDVELRNACNKVLYGN